MENAPQNEYDFLVIGAGIAGASVAAHLAGTHRVALLEQEEFAGFHSTGRSAALFAKSYGNRVIRAITAASEAFFVAPPAGFADHPLLTPRGHIYIARQEQLSRLQALAKHSGPQSALEEISTCAAKALCPILKTEMIAGVLHDPSAQDIDVDGLHKGFLRQVRALGSTVFLNAKVTELHHDNTGWIASTPHGAYRSDVVINAAGAWGDHIAKLAGLPPSGLAPMRRSAALVAPPPGKNPDLWPLVLDIDESFYFKPDAGNILISPADETLSPACDSMPDDLDIAIAIDRVQQIADLPVKRIEHQWSGLRTFAPDRSPIVGYDPSATGFFWLVGQGGYGIQTAPAMGEIAACLARGHAIPSHLRAFGVSAADLTPDRFDLTNKAAAST